MSKQFVITVADDFVPKNEDAFAAILSALEHFEIPASVVEQKQATKPIKPRIVIGLEGGIIQGCTSNVPVSYLVYDYDTEGCDYDELRTVPALDRKDTVQIFDGGECGCDVDAPAVKLAFEFAAKSKVGS